MILRFSCPRRWCQRPSFGFTKRDGGYCGICLDNLRLQCRRFYRIEAEDCGISSACAEEGAGPFGLDAACIARVTDP